MARGRMISKAISLDEKVESLSDDTARLLFTWMIPHLDCEGRMYGEAQVFKSIVAPRRNYSIKKIEKYLTEMEKIGLIIRYSINGNTYISAPNFEKHQPGLRKEKEAQSQIPPPTPDLGRTKDGVSPSQEKGKLKRKEDKEENEEERSSSSSPENNDLNIFETYEQEIGKLTPAIRKEIEEASKTYPDDWIADAIKEAARANKPSWRYVLGILENWGKEGRAVPGPAEEELILGMYSRYSAIAMAEGRQPALKANVVRVQEELRRLNIPFNEPKKEPG